MGQFFTCLKQGCHVFKQPLLQVLSTLTNCNQHVIYLECLLQFLDDDPAVLLEVDEVLVEEAVVGVRTGDPLAAPEGPQNVAILL